MTVYDIEKTQNVDVDAKALLLELRQISDRRSKILYENIKQKNDMDVQSCSRYDRLEENEKDAANDFLFRTPEASIFNQYWYSRNTINSLCISIQEGLDQLKEGKSIAFLSTPSLYFAFPTKAAESCKLFDFDKTWSSDPGYIFYDYNKPEGIPSHLKKSFDMVVIDPPFITKSVWEKYARTARFLLKTDPKNTNISGQTTSMVVGTTVAENNEFMSELFCAKPAIFRPCIPNLVYQYSIFTNFCSKVLCEVNPEIANR